jgi:hypothetical protein
VSGFDICRPLPASSCGEFQREDSLLLNQTHNGFQRVFGFIK